MAFLTPNYQYTVNGLLIKEKIIPDGTVWKDATKAKKAGFRAGALYKKQAKLCGTGKPAGITVHNTSKLAGVSASTTQAEQYTRATYNENMKSARVHFYVDDKCAWQMLKTGLGISKNDPKGSAEVGWHAGDGSVKTGGNMTNISIEMIMDGWNGEYNQAVARNGARLVAYLLKFYGLSIDNLQTHTYWINKAKGISGSHDYMNTYKIPNVFKMCPLYIIPHWSEFLSMVKTYMGGSTNSNTPTNNTTVNTVNTSDIKIGDIVQFTGNTHYSSTNASKGFSVNPGEAKVTNIYKTGKHSIHLIATKGSTSKVYGWVDIKDVKKVSKTIGVGTKVKIKSSAKYYYDNGPAIPAFVKNIVHVVTQVNSRNKRVLLGKKVDNNQIVAGINTWVDSDNLDVV